MKTPVYICFIGGQPVIVSGNIDEILECARNMSSIDVLEIDVDLSNLKTYKTKGMEARA